MYVAEDSERHVCRRSPSLTLDKFTGSDEDLQSPRWVEILALDKEYAIYEFPTTVFRLMFKLATRYSNLKVVSGCSSIFCLFAVLT